MGAFRAKILFRPQRILRGQRDRRSPVQVEGVRCHRSLIVGAAYLPGDRSTRQLSLPEQCTLGRGGRSCERLCRPFSASKAHLLNILSMPPSSIPPQRGAPNDTGATHPLMGLSMALLGGLALARLLSPSRPRVFVSYDHDEDLRYRNLLRAWDANSEFPFTFDLTSPVARIRSDDEVVVKRALTTKLKASEYLLVVVGKATWRSRFVTWEIERAKEPDVNLKLVAVKLQRTNRSPKSLLAAGTSWANRFSVDAVAQALRDAQAAG